jgi:hypothetical protein
MIRQDRKGLKVAIMLLDLKTAFRPLRTRVRAVINKPIGDLVEPNQ